MDILEIALKLLLAVALGGLIGIERESSQKPAGLRTNILICLGSTMMMSLAMMTTQGREGSSGEVMRMAAGIITGIGFIGAGTIIQSEGIIVGLTTAATLWSVAGLGLVIGSGYYLIAIIFTVVIFLTLAAFRQFEEHHFKKNTYRYHIKAKHSKDTMSNIRKLALHDGIKFKEISHQKQGNFSFISLSFPASEEKEQAFNESLLNLAEVTEIKID